MLLPVLQKPTKPHALCTSATFLAPVTSLRHDPHIRVPPLLETSPDRVTHPPKYASFLLLPTLFPNQPSRRLPVLEHLLEQCVHG